MFKFIFSWYQLRIVIIAYGLLQGSAYADSLWTKRVVANTNLYADNRARYVGDTVTVVIDEETDIQGLEDTKLDNSASFSSKIDASNFVVGKDGVAQANRYLPNASGSHDTSFEGDGEYKSARNVRFHLTAVITEMLGNGNMIIEGKRDVSVNKERYTLRVSGIIRPIDIDENNIVLSRKIANANISLAGKGFLTRTSKRGWGWRLVDVLWPF